MSIVVLLGMPALYANDTQNDAIINEIKSRYDVSFAKASVFCGGLSEKIDAIKILAGVGMGSGGVGAVAGGVGVYAGIKKSAVDDEILRLASEAGAGDLYKAWKANSDTAPNGESWGHESNINDLKTVISLKLTALEKEAAKFGNIRTAGSFVAGGAGAVGAVTSFAGTKQFDNLILEMNGCDTYVSEIEQQKNELLFAGINDVITVQMDNIVNSCKGFNSKNIAEVRGRLGAAGIVSALGAVGGVVGGIASAYANEKEAGNNSNTVATVSAGVAAAGNLGGAILSGMTLAGLIKNGEIAAKCADAF